MVSVAQSMVWICQSNFRPRTFDAGKSSASELSNVSAASQLTAETILSTDTGKQVHLLKYVPPGQDRFGARYYFPRYLASGAPLLGTNDKELQFETRIDNHPVKVKFDLKKMRYEGQLES